MPSPPYKDIVTYVRLQYNILVSRKEGRRISPPLIEDGGILRQMEDERKKKELALSDKVVIQSADIQAEYRALNIKNRPITKESLRNFISLMKKYNLAESLDSNPVNPEHRLLIYPSIRYALPVEDIRQVYDRLRNYAKDPDAFNPEEDSNEDLNRY